MRRIGQAWENWAVLTGKRVPYEGLLTILARRRRIAGIHFAEIWFFEENEINTLGGKRVALFVQMNSVLRPNGDFLAEVDPFAPRRIIVGMFAFAANHRLSGPLWKAAGVIVDAPNSVTVLFVRNFQ